MLEKANMEFVDLADALGVSASTARRIGSGKKGLNEMERRGLLLIAQEVTDAANGDLPGADEAAGGRFARLTEQVGALAESVRLLRDFALGGESEEMREQLERADAFAQLHEPSTGRLGDQKSGGANQ